ncbi:MAG: CBS domain-containing protein [Candidatus Woesearchaeota archaeon]
MKTGIRVHDAMTVRPVTVSPSLDAKECAKLMLKKKVGSLIVTESKKILGIITEKDIVEKIVAQSRDANILKAKDVMTKKVKFIAPNIDMYDAVTIMKKEKFRRLPVVHNDELVGMLTINDVMKIQPFLLDYIKEKFNIISIQKKKEKYIEGECEGCSNYSQLHDVNDRLICSVCMDEEGINTED